MPLMERAGSKDARTLIFQCPKCHYSVYVQLGRPGDRVYDVRTPCPCCITFETRPRLDTRE